MRRRTSGEIVETVVESVRGHWDAYYANIADHLNGLAPLAVTAEQAREVVRVLEAATRSSAETRDDRGPVGGLTRDGSTRKDASLASPRVGNTHPRKIVHSTIWAPSSG